VSYRPGEAELGCARRYGRGGTDRRIRGKRVLVTGGTKGIGLAIVTKLAAGGAKVMTTARSAAPGDIPAWCVKADVSTREGAEKVIQATLDKLGGPRHSHQLRRRFDAPAGGVLALTDEHWHQALALNLMSAVRLDRGFLPSMLEQGFGVNYPRVVPSKRTLPLHESTLAYAAAKAALTNYSKGLRSSWGPRGISRELGCPGVHPRRRRR